MTPRRPSAPLGQIFETRRRFGPKVGVLRLILPLADLAPSPVGRWNRGRSVIVRRLSHRPADIENVHKLQILRLGERSAPELDFATPGTRKGASSIIGHVDTAYSEKQRQYCCGHYLRQK